jgi:hypothetical protein
MQKKTTVTQGSVSMRGFSVFEQILVVATSVMCATRCNREQNRRKMLRNLLKIWLVMMVVNRAFDYTEGKSINLEFYDAVDVWCGLSLRKRVYLVEKYAAKCQVSRFDACFEILPF